MPKKTKEEPMSMDVFTAIATEYKGNPEDEVNFDAMADMMTILATEIHKQLGLNFKDTEEAITSVVARAMEQVEHWDKDKRNIFEYSTNIMMTEFAFLQIHNEPAKKEPKPPATRFPSIRALENEVVRLEKENNYLRETCKKLNEEITAYVKYSRRIDQ